MTEPSIRRARSADAAALADIGALTFIETFAHLYRPEDLQAFLAEAHSVEAVAKDLANPRKALWIVERGGQPVGYALAGPCDLPHDDVTDACGELKRFYMRRDLQGGGVGRRLFDEIMDWLQAAGPRDVWIGVWSENHKALRFYERNGFAKAGEYGFRVGEQLDREFILKRPAASFAGAAPQLA
jgi:ribosomal protein S18 acetylase RimI-like enzyme